MGRALLVEVAQSGKASVELVQGFLDAAQAEHPELAAGVVFEGPHRLMRVLQLASAVLKASAAALEGVG